MLRLSHWDGVGFRERLHPVDELHDPVRFVADQPRERPIFVADVRVQQLRRSANARKRVLDLVRQHEPKRRDRACGAAMGELPVYFFGNGSFLQHNRHLIVSLRQRRDENVDSIPIARSGRGNIDLVAIHGGAIAERVRNETQDGRVCGNKLGQSRPHERAPPHVEECLGRRVDVGDQALRVDRKQRLGERIQHPEGVRAPLSRMGGHAACLARSASASKAHASSARAFRESTLVTISRRSVSSAPARSE